jgi:nitroimidazol reductase NimA-like FMN-containing flavoprotein (pyridoxamine 5'-phosphate oxidase superfamily)/nucleotide-binding universal stress UspA family protein
LHAGKIMGAPGSPSIYKLLLATDFSEPAARAAEAARREAQGRHARLDVLHVVRSQAHSAAAEAQVAELAASLATEVPASPRVRIGSPAREIVRFAEEHEVDAIVLGGHGGTGATHALLGSVAERVVRTSTRPVLVVPSHRGGALPPSRQRCLVCGILSEDLVCEPCRANLRAASAAPQWAAHEEGFVGELDREQCEHLLRTELIGRLACQAGGSLYVVPMAYAYEDGAMFLRSGEGKKVRMMRESPAVCFQVDHILDLANWRSVIVWGTFRELHGAEAAAGLQRLVRRLRAWAGQVEGWPAPSFREVDDALGHRTVGPGRSAVVGRVEVTAMKGRYQHR